MKSMTVLAVTISVALIGLPLYAADAEKPSKPKQGTAQKKTEQKQKRSDTGPQGEEQTGGAGPSGPSSGENVKAPQHEGAGSKPTH
jgi:hypothetical protein